MSSRSSRHHSMRQSHDRPYHQSITPQGPQGPQPPQPHPTSPPAHHDRSYRRSNTPQVSQPHQPRPVSPYHPNSYNQSAHQGGPSSIGWSPPSGQAPSPGPAYTVPGGRPQRADPQPLDRFYRSDRSDRDTGDYSGGYRPRGSATPTSSVSQDECRAWFFAIDQDGNGELSSEELRSALLTNGGLRFSANTVRFLMSIFDLDGNGVIGYDEFEPLWLYMNTWWQMFDSFDTDRDGRIDAAELGRALAHYHLRVGSHIIDMVVRKYGTVPPRSRVHGYSHVLPRPQMDLDQFLCACVVVQKMCELYDKCKSGGRSEISRDEFLQAIISLP